MAVIVYPSKRATSGAPLERVGMTDKVDAKRQGVALWRVIGRNNEDTVHPAQTAGVCAFAGSFTEPSASSNDVKFCACCSTV